MRRSRDLRILVLAGGAGYGNMGDEGALSMLLKYLNRDFPSSKIIVCTHDPHETKEMHHVDVCGLSSLYTIVSFLESDVLAVGGAGLVNNSNFFESGMGHSPLFFVPGVPTLLFGIAAKILGKRVQFYAIGVTAVPHPVLKPLLRIAINLSDFVSVRDSISKVVLTDLGVTKSISVQKEPVLELDFIDSSTARNLLLNESVDLSKFLIGLSLRYLEDEECNKRIISESIKVIDWLVQTFDCNVVFFPMSRHKLKRVENDLLIAREIEQKLKCKESFKVISGRYSPQQMKGMVRQMNFFIGMRLHSLVFAMGIPKVGIIYDEKVLAFLLDNGEKGLDVKQIRFEELKSEISRKLQIPPTNKSGCGRL